MNPPREALQPVCRACRRVFVDQSGDTCPGCEMGEAWADRFRASRHPSQTSLGAF